MNAEPVGHIQRRRFVKFTDHEVVSFLTAYIAHPGNWQEILGHIRENQGNLSFRAQEYYRTTSLHRIRDRLSKKLNSLLMKPLNNIANLEIRNLMRTVRENERQHVVQPQPPTENIDEPGPARVILENPPRARFARPDLREAIISSMSSGESDEQEQMRPRPARRRRRDGRPALAELVRQNHEPYNRWMTEKLPRIGRELGLGSDDDE